MDVDTTMLAVVDFIMSHDGITVGADLDACQSVAVYVIVLDQTTAFTKNINAALMPVVNLISTDGRIRVGSDPYTRKVIRVNPVFNELALARFMHVNASRLSVVNFTAYYSWVCSSYNYAT